MNLSDPLRWNYERPESGENENLLLQDLSDGSSQLIHTGTTTSSTENFERSGDHLAFREPIPRITPADLLGSGSNGLTEPSFNGSVYLTSARMSQEPIDPKGLHEYIKNYLSLVPPKIVMRVRGSSWNATQARARARVDASDPLVIFDFTIALREVLEPNDEPMWRASHTRSCNAQPTRGLSEDADLHGDTHSFENPEQSLPGCHGHKQRSRNWTQYVRLVSFTRVFNIFPDVPALFQTPAPYLSDWRTDHAHDGGLVAYQKMSLPCTADIIESDQRLLASCEDFCAEKTSRKRFRVVRDVTGLNLDAIKAGVAAHLYLHHFGRLEIGFTMVDHHVDIYPPGSLHQICAEQRVLRTCFRALSIILYGLAIVSSICLLFTGLLLAVQVEMAAISYLTWRHTHELAYIYFRALLGTIAVGGTLLLLLAFVRKAVIAAFEVKEWSGHHVEWTVRRWDDSTGQRTRQHAGLNEAQWVQKHASFLCRLVENKFHGDATDLMDVCM